MFTAWFVRKYQLEAFTEATVTGSLTHVLSHWISLSKPLNNGLVKSTAFLPCWSDSTNSLLRTAAMLLDPAHVRRRVEFMNRFPRILGSLSAPSRSVLVFVKWMCAICSQFTSYQFWFLIKFQILKQTFLVPIADNVISHVVYVSRTITLQSTATWMWRITRIIGAPSDGCSVSMWHRIQIRINAYLSIII